MFELHCYVCVAVLATCKECVCIVYPPPCLLIWSRTLEELDGGEVRMMLLDLPPLDIDRVSSASHLVCMHLANASQLLQDAANLRVAHTLPRPADSISI
jgi:hypothetical protein